jgi:hypothetical protein
MTLKPLAWHRQNRLLQKPQTTRPGCGHFPLNSPALSFPGRLSYEYSNGIRRNKSERDLFGASSRLRCGGPSMMLNKPSSNDRSLATAQAATASARPVRNQPLQQSPRLRRQQPAHPGLNLSPGCNRYPPQMLPFYTIITHRRPDRSASNGAELTATS